MKAFPWHEGFENEAGMDLRDYFAAKAMAYWLHYPIELNDMNRVAKKAYEMADAMMKVREQ
jgi:hypothetical protein